MRVISQAASFSLLSQKSCQQVTPPLNSATPTPRPAWSWTPTSWLVRPPCFA
jgi:hypothetical protein